MNNPMDESKAHEMKKGDVKQDKKEKPTKSKKMKFKMNKKGVISKIKNC